MFVVFEPSTDTYIHELIFNPLLRAAYMVPFARTCPAYLAVHKNRVLRGRAFGNTGGGIFSIF